MRASLVSIRFAGLIVAAVLLCTTLSDVQAWTDKGHRIIGHVAHDLLSPKTRGAIRQLMGRDDLATFGLYLDQHKDQLEQEIPGSRRWHFDDVPICTTKPYSEYCPEGACASTQILRHYRLLADAHAPKQRKRFAVLVLTHLLADIHQPLHAADNNDRGGNQIKIRLPDSREMNLHAAWDAAFVERLLGERPEVAVAKRLLRKYTTQATVWQAGKLDLAKVQAWIGESNHLAKEVAYGKLPGFACGADSAQMPVVLSEDYLQQAEAAVAEQLAKAGYRLASILNRALGN